MVAVFRNKEDRYKLFSIGPSPTICSPCGSLPAWWSCWHPCLAVCGRPSVYFSFACWTLLSVTLCGAIMWDGCSLAFRRIWDLLSVWYGSCKLGARLFVFQIKVRKLNGRPHLSHYCLGCIIAWTHLLDKCEELMCSWQSSSILMGL